MGTNRFVSQTINQSITVGRKQSFHVVGEPKRTHLFLLLCELSFLLALALALAFALAAALNSGTLGVYLLVCGCGGVKKYVMKPP